MRPLRERRLSCLRSAPRDRRVDVATRWSVGAAGLEGLDDRGSIVAGFLRLRLDRRRGGGELSSPRDLARRSLPLEARARACFPAGGDGAKADLWHGAAAL